jgi:hypothetical protein
MTSGVMKISSFIPPLVQQDLSWQVRRHSAWR